MFTSPNSGESVKARVSSCSSLVESIQDITLRAMLNRAVDLVADCSDKCNRQAEEGYKHDLAKRERSLQGIALSSMWVHPTGRGHEADKDGQEGCSTTAKASLIG